jgi:tripeptidyl-peptidase-1
VISYQGQLALIAGTSAAAPTFAGIVALLNDVQLSAGKPSLGFLNPFLYSMCESGLNDVTSGNAPGCGTQGFYVGFLLHMVYGRIHNSFSFGLGQAAPGWDPVTGLGTPDFGKLKNILTKNILPPPTTLGGLLTLLQVLLGITVNLKLL